VLWITVSTQLIVNVDLKEKEMPLDKDAQAVVDQMKSDGPRYLKPVQEIRDQALADLKANPPKLEPVAKVEDRMIPGPAGELWIRIFTPEGTGPMPVISYIHGGGWTLGSIKTHDASCRTVANMVGAVVVASEFRLAPENKFPASLEDVYAATLWTSQNAESLGADSNRLAVIGNSSGANLAAAVSLLSRDRGAPRIAYQALICPAVEYACNTKSAIDNAEGYGLTTEEMKWFWNNYLHTSHEANNPYACPLRALDLSGLPPAVVLTAEFDPLRDEGEAYASRLKEAGVPVIYHCFEGMIHGFLRDNMAAQAKSALHEAARVLKEQIGN
jgi:acetyl esterase